jgi:hypothetical protein
MSRGRILADKGVEPCRNPSDLHGSPYFRRRDTAISARRLPSIGAVTLFSNSFEEW